MRRFEIREGARALPPIDCADAEILVGSGPNARVRLPARAAAEAHVRIAGDRWEALAPLVVAGAAVEAGASGPLDGAVELGFGEYAVVVSSAPGGALASPPMRTESLARELVRGLLGANAAPSLVLESGPRAGTKRLLSAPEATLVIGRGDEAGWVILDGDLSRTHAEIFCGWDGITIADLDSKNGTRVDGTVIGRAPVPLSDGASIALGSVRLRFHDPAERHLRGDGLSSSGYALPAAPPAAAPAAPVARTSPVAIAALALTALALAGLVWILAT
ncbi:MAG TPA: FHA domain-containing protein [Kofleriaceae bacterium]|jgi:hypothetical protein